ncbi:Cupredoxin, partial [Aureobasidium melanogenum]
MRSTAGLLASVAIIAAQAASAAGRAADACSTVTLNGELPNPTPSNFKFSGKVRNYYVAADEVDWNFAPTGWDNYMGVPIDVSPRAKSSGYLPRTIWRKALYRGYTDASFMQQTERPAYEGLLGPIIRAEVGDLIEIMFLNNLSANYASMHSMGLMYDKGSEGGDYPNNTMPGQESPFVETQAVPPGGCVVYKWMVNEGAGPNTANEPAKGHSYHSYVTMQEGTNAGLIGPTYIYPRGQMEHVMANWREFPVLYMSIDEQSSFMSQINEQLNQTWYGTSSSSSSTNDNRTNPLSDGYEEFQDLLSSNGGYGNESIWKPQITNLLSSGHGNAPTFYSMNGYVLANNPLFEMCRDDNVLWYTYAYGSGSHVFHMHGNGFTENGISMPSASINDGKMHTLVMTAAGVGKWEVICHVNNHNTMGMVADYRVFDGYCPITPLGSDNGTNWSNSTSGNSTSGKSW